MAMQTHLMSACLVGLTEAGHIVKNCCLCCFKDLCASGIYNSHKHINRRIEITMSELFTNQSAISVLSLPEAGSNNINAHDMAWQDSGAKGFWIKPLFEDNRQGLRTWLMKVDAGAFSPMHAHEEIEQIYVIEGSFSDQDKTYKSGDLIVRAPGVMHTGGSEEGSLVMLFYSPAAVV